MLLRREQKLESGKVETDKAGALSVSFKRDLETKPGLRLERARPALGGDLPESVYGEARNSGSRMVKNVPRIDAHREALALGEAERLAGICIERELTPVVQRP